MTCIICQGTIYPDQEWETVGPHEPNNAHSLCCRKAEAEIERLRRK